ncbi:DUF134 domain-containing protein [uncultured Lutibacter sp.]|uniref:DUF134 domain-containing protein n=1 Tax=uncultured Lutibacter sp. TaxID=437739 RepID=UPI00261F3C8F|nr:DUF134 domain-containing protein [uncultured Lutibacter sp.]
MARPEKNRKILQPPIMKGFKPYGIPQCKMESIRLSLEEYESIRLVNYEMLPQKEAAVHMNISRPTLTRIYNKALKNITKAFIEGKTIEIEGGNYEFEKDWYKCRKCHKLVEEVENKSIAKKKKICCAEELININEL